MMATDRSKHPLTPHQFLRELGVQKRSELEFGSDAWAAAVRQAGADPDAVDPDAGFGPTAGDVFFANEQIGRSTLSHNYERYLRDLKALGEFWKFPESPRRITDLGGGAGVIPIILPTATRPPKLWYTTGPRGRSQRAGGWPKPAASTTSSSGRQVTTTWPAEGLRE